MHLKDLLSEVGQQLNLTNLINMQEPAAKLVINDNLTVHIEASLDGKSAHLHTTLLSLDQETPATVYRDLLKGQLLGVASKECYFALMEGSDELYLFRNFPLDHIQPHELISGLDDLVEVATSWLSRLSYQPATSNQTTNVPQMGDFMMV